MVMMISIEKILNDGTRSFGPAIFSISVDVDVFLTDMTVIHYLDNNYIM
jgi:hypothetical protein